MNATTEKLLAVQELDRRIRRIEQELADIPARKAAIENTLSDVKGRIEAARKEGTAQRAHAHEIELEVEANRQKITKYREQQMNLKTNEEFRTMESEIRGVTEGIAGLEDQEILVMEQIEQNDQTIASLQEELRGEQERAARECSVFDERAVHLQENLKSILTERQAAIDGIDPEWLRRYDAIFRRRGDYALVRVEHGVCEGCHMKLPPQVCNDALKGDAMVSCDYCGRLLC